MSLQQSYIALDWVKDALDETLQHVQSLLVQHTPASLAEAKDGLHQISGTLLMVQLQEPLALSERLERVLQHVVSGQVLYERVADAVQQAMAILLDELDYMQRNKTSRPMLLNLHLQSLNVFLPKGEDAQLRSIVFVPDLSLVADHYAADPQHAVLKQKLAQGYQHFLAQWYDRQQLPEATQGLTRIATMLRQTAATRQEAALWQAAEVLHRAVESGHLESRALLAPLFSRLERVLASEAHRRPAEESDQPPESSLEEALLVDLMRVLDPEQIPDVQIVQLRQLYGMESPDVRGVSHRLLDSALQQLVAAQAMLLIDRDATAIALREAGRLLNISGWQGFAEQTQAILQRLLTLTPSDERTALNEALEGLIHQLQHTINLTLSSSQNAERDVVQDARHAAVRESRTALEYVKSILNQYHHQSGEVQALANIPAQLSRVSGVFTMLALPRAADLLSRMIIAMRTHILTQNQPPHWRQVDLLAQVVSAIEYYLDGLAGQYQDERILDNAEQRLSEFLHPGSAPAPVPVGGDKRYDDHTGVDAESVVVHESSSASGSIVATSKSEALGDEFGLDDLGTGQASSDHTSVTVIEPASAGRLSDAHPIVHDAAMSNTEPMSTQAAVVAVTPVELLDNAFALDDLSGGARVHAQEQHAEVNAVDAKPASTPDRHELSYEAGEDENPYRDRFDLGDTQQDTFVKNADEALEGITEHFPVWVQAQDESDLKQLSFAFRTLKDSGRTAGAQTVGELSCAVENLLKRVLDHRVAEIEIEAVAAVVQYAYELLPELIFNFSERQMNSPEQLHQVETLIAATEELAGGQLGLEEPEQVQVNTTAPEAVSAIAAAVPQAAHTFDLEELPKHGGVGQNPYNDSFDMDEDVRNIFVEEADEVLEAISEHYPGWVQTQDSATLKELRRAFHTLKGSGRMVGARTVGELSWSVENLLNRVIDHTVREHEAVAAVIQYVYQLLPELINNFADQRFNEPEQLHQVVTLITAAEQLASGKIVAAPVVPADDDLDDDGEQLILDEEAPASVMAAVEKPVTTVSKPVKAAANTALPLHLLGDKAPHGVPEDDFARYADDDTVREIFLEEAGEVLQELETHFPAWAVQLDHKEALTTIRRNFHTLKGSGRMVGALVLGELAWGVERLLNGVLDQSVSVNQSIIQYVGEVIAVIPTLVQDFAAERQPSVDILPMVQVAWLLRDGHALSAAQIQAATQSAMDASASAESADAIDADTAATADAFDHLTDSILAELHAEVDHAATDVAMIKDTPNKASTQTVASPVQSAENLLHELDQQVLEIFVAEADEYLTTIHDFAHQSIAARPEVVMTNDRLLRALHTLRGSASMAGVEPIYQLAHALESEFKRLMREHQPVEDDHLDALVTLVRLTRVQLDILKSGHMPELDDAGMRLIRHMEEMTAAHGQISEGASFTGLVTELMDIGIDDVLDAEWTLKEHLTCEDAVKHIEVMIGQLGHLAEAVQQVPLLPLTTLVHTLHQTYLHVQQYPAFLDRHHVDQLTETLLLGHVDLTRLFDALAASQEIISEPQVLTALQAVQAQQPEMTVEDVMAPSAADSSVVTSVAEAAAEVSTVSTASALVYPQDREHDPELLSIFLEEAEELVHEIDQSFDQWEQAPQEIAPLKALQRHLHTLKGGARMAQVQSLGDYTHELETAYERLVVHAPSGQVASPLWIKFLRHAQDQIAQQVDGLIQSGTSFYTPVETELTQQYLKSGNEQLLADYFARLEQQDSTGIADRLDDVAAVPVVAAVAVSSIAVPIRQHAEPVAAPVPVPVPAPVVKPVPEPKAPVKAAAQAEPEVRISSLKQMQVLAEAWDEGSAPDTELLEIFLDEAAEIIDQSSLQLTEWLGLVRSGQAADQQTAKALLQKLQRNLHTFKGGARMAGVEALGDLSHEMEFVYEDLALARKPVTAEIGRLLNQSHDWLADSIGVLDRGERPATPTLLIEALQIFRKDADALHAWMVAHDTAAVPQVEAASQDNVDTALEPVVAEVTVLTKAEAQTKSQPAPVSGGAEPPPMSGAFPKRDTLDASASEMVRVSAGLMDKMINLAGENAINRARVEMGLTGISQLTDEMGMTIQRLAEQLRRMDVELESQIIARHQQEVEAMGQYQDFDPLEMDRYSSINQLSKSLFESVSDLLDFKNTLVEKARDSESLLLQQSRTQTELQEGLMSSRLVPFSRLVPRLQRVVRQTATELGKTVDFVVLNAEGELDRSVLERMIAPLEHMLRNSVDHGQEDPETRVRLGKSQKGTITLSVQREGNEVMLTLQDDGAGIAVEAVRQKAIERGLLDADVELSDAEVRQFIFHAGLSTAAKVTQISGRGVGMDVVQSEIRQLGGSIAVNSVESMGTTFIIRLPLTVAVTDALRVRVGDRVLAVSLAQITRIVRVAPKELEELYGTGRETMTFDGTPYRMRYLGELIGGGNTPTLYGQSLPLPVLLIEHDGQHTAIQVDQLLGSREEIVIKPLGLQLAHVSTVSGATILGDGSVVIILDMMAIARMAMSHTRHTLATDILSEPIPVIKQKKVIMVVDDSVTVRKVTTRLLERNGYQVVQAKDGVDAISKLEEVHPDLMLLDIEMPRMDGFEVINLVRHNPRLSELPIIMITSRTGEKHRERAYGAGVNGYMGKPFQEQILLENIAELLEASMVV